MMTAKDFYGAAKPLARGDVETIAGYLGCHVAAVRAVLAVEARNSGFDGLGRPKMLFEPHVFWRELGPGPKRDQAKAQGLAYGKWKPGSYPLDSYPRLLKAMLIDETAALRSASWGMGQVMGFNHKTVGFDSPQAFVKAMTYSEGAHLYAMARFIVGKKLQRFLRGQNWSSFAKGYNGSGYAKHGYHTKLEAAYTQRPEREKFTPPPASMTDLNMLLGLAEPPKPQPKPKPAPVPAPERKPSVETPQARWIKTLLGLALAAGAAVASWFAFGG